MSAEAPKIEVDPRVQFDGCAAPEDRAWTELKVGDRVMHRRNQDLQGVITRLDPIRSTGLADLYKDYRAQADVVLDDGKFGRWDVVKLVKVEEKPRGGKR